MTSTYEEFLRWKEAQNQSSDPHKQQVIIKASNRDDERPDVNLENEKLANLRNATCAKGMGKGNQNATSTAFATAHERKSALGDGQDDQNGAEGEDGRINRKQQFIQNWRNKKQAEAVVEEEIVLRDPKAKIITFELLSVNQFSIKQGGIGFILPEDLIQIIKRHGGIYSFEQKEWLVSMVRYKALAMEIAKYCRQEIIDLDPITQMAFDVCEYQIPFSDQTKKNLVGYDFRLDLVSGYKPSIKQLPQSLQHSLYNFQKVGIQYGIDRFGRCMLGDEMGVGKTIQAISIAYLFKRDWPVLIITPSSLKYSWRDEIMTWIDTIKPEQIQVFSKSTQDFNNSCCVYIMSYVLATKLAAFISRRQFRMCICDEAHYLKSRDSQRSRYLIPLLIKIKRVLLLSGTPMLARPNELYNLLRILRPDIFYSFKEFGFRYCSPRESYFGIDWTGSSNQRELHSMLEKGIMIRRLKSQVLKELPAKRRQKIIVQTDPQHMRKIQQILKRIKTWDDKIQQTGQQQEGLLKALADDFDNFVKDGSNAQNDPTLQAIDDKYNYLLNAYSFTGLAKVRGVLEFLETLIENKTKFILFAHHYDVMDAIEDFIVKKKVGYIRIDGQVEATKRYEAVRRFQNDPNILVGILALTASSQGITLTAASTVVFAEMNWTPGIMVQAEDRTHRIGQSAAVNVYYCYGENTVDQMIYPRLRLKSEVFSNILDGKNTEFIVQNDCGEDDAQENEEMMIDEQERKRLEREEKRIKKIQGDMRSKQTCLSDFFYNQGPTQAATTQANSSVVASEQIQDEDNHSDSIDSNQEFDGPPTPPLVLENRNFKEELKEIGEENFEEGTDSKWKAYQNIRKHKKKLFDAQKDMIKQADLLDKAGFGGSTQFHEQQQNYAEYGAVNISGIADGNSGGQNNGLKKGIDKSQPLVYQQPRDSTIFYDEDIIAQQQQRNPLDHKQVKIQQQINDMNQQNEIEINKAKEKEQEKLKQMEELANSAFEILTAQAQTTQLNEQKQVEIQPQTSAQIDQPQPQYQNVQPKTSFQNIQPQQSFQKVQPSPQIQNIKAQEQVQKFEPQPQFKQFEPQPVFQHNQPQKQQQKVEQVEVPVAPKPKPSGLIYSKIKHELPPSQVSNNFNNPQNQNQYQNKYPNKFLPQNQNQNQFQQNNQSQYQNSQQNNFNKFQKPGYRQHFNKNFRERGQGFEDDHQTDNFNFLEKYSKPDPLQTSYDNEQFILMQQLKKCEEKFFSRMPEEENQQPFIDMLVQSFNSNQTHQQQIHYVSSQVDEEEKKVSDKVGITLQTYTFLRFRFHAPKIQPNPIFKQIITETDCQLQNFDDQIEPHVWCDEYNLHSEADIFPQGLPDLDDVRNKKRKSDFEKVLVIDEDIGACPTPLAQYQVLNKELLQCSCKSLNQSDNNPDQKNPLLPQSSQLKCSFCLARLNGEDPTQGVLNQNQRTELGLDASTTGQQFSFEFDIPASTNLQFVLDEAFQYMNEGYSTTPQLYVYKPELDQFFTHHNHEHPEEIKKSTKPQHQFQQMQPNKVYEKPYKQQEQFQDKGKKQVEQNNPEVDSMMNYMKNCNQSESNLSQKQSSKLDPYQFSQQSSLLGQHKTSELPNAQVQRNNSVLGSQVSGVTVMTNVPADFNPQNVNSNDKIGNIAGFIGTPMDSQSTQNAGRRNNPTKTSATAGSARFNFKKNTKR